MFDISRTGTSTFAKLILEIDYPDIRLSSSSDPIADRVKRSNTVWGHKKETRKRIYDSSEYKYFICVRNPYDRVFSSYRQFRRHSSLGRKYPKIRKMKFHKFIQSELFVKMLNSDKHFYSMCNYFSNFDHSRMIEIFRFENYEQGLKKILKSVGIDVEIPNYNCNNNFKDYRTQYREEDKKIIEKFYEWDLEKLNYSFDSYGYLPTVNELINLE